MEVKTIYQTRVVVSLYCPNDKPYLHVLKTDDNLQSYECVDAGCVLYGKHFRSDVPPIILVEIAK